MNWWKRDWKIWSAITLGALLSWGVYSFVGAEYRPFGTDSSVKLQTVKIPLSFATVKAFRINFLDSINSPYISFGSKVNFSVPGGFVFFDTEGVQFPNVPYESTEGTKGEVVYDSNLGCLKINVDGADTWKTLCGETSTQSCASDPSAGHWYCESDFIKYKNPSTCEETSFKCPLGCETKNGIGVCKNACSLDMVQCLSNRVEIACDNGIEKEIPCATGEVCVDGQGCLEESPSGLLPACKLGGCTEENATRCPLGGASYEKCTNAGGCLQWRNVPCSSGMLCLAGVGICESSEFPSGSPTSTPTRTDNCKPCFDDGDCGSCQLGTGRGACFCKGGLCRAPVSGRQSYESCSVQSGSACSKLYNDTCYIRSGGTCDRGICESILE